MGDTAVVTGANSGIGLATALRLATDGYRVVAGARRDQGLADIEAAAGAAGLDVQPLLLDVTDDASVDAALSSVLAQGPVSVLVNNAGITGLESGAAHDPEHASLEQWQAVHRTNLDGVFLGCKHALRTMRRRPPGSPGAIVNISSRSGGVGVPAAAAYASSKAAVRNHTKSVALYCAEQGLAIRCNSIHPAAVLTPMWEPMLGQGPEREARMAEFVADTPLRRFGRPEEVAALAVMLASDESAYVTGSEFHIDGGLLAGSAAAPRRGEAA